MPNSSSISAAKLRANGSLGAEESDITIVLSKQQLSARTYSVPIGKGDRLPGAEGPLVLHFHGGNFASGDLNNGRCVARMLVSAGATVVSMAYPLAPLHPFPDAIEAGYEALEWLFKQRTKLAGKGARVYLAGEEAGGNLAASLALIARDRAHPPLAGQILLSPMLDPCAGTASLRKATGDVTDCRYSDGWQQYLRGPRDAEHPYAVPGSSRRLCDMPPALVLVGQDDPMRDEAAIYAKRLDAAGVPVRSEVLSVAQGWPEALTDPGTASACACEVVVTQKFREFFADTRTLSAPQPPH